MTDTRTVAITTTTEDWTTAHETVESGRAQAAQQLGVDPDTLTQRGSVNSTIPKPDDMGSTYQFVTTWGVADAPAT